MDKLAAPQFAQILNGLTEVYGVKPVTPKALEMWFESLKEFDTHVVFSTLNGWAKTHTKFPTPNEVWKASNEVSGRHRDHAAEETKKALQRWTERGSAAHAHASMGVVRDTLATPKPDPRTHWQRVMATEGLPHISYRYAQEVLGKHQAIERQPGQDDEEREAA